MASLVPRYLLTRATARGSACCTCQNLQAGPSSRRPMRRDAAMKYEVKGLHTGKSHQMEISPEENNSKASIAPANVDRIKSDFRTSEDQSQSIDIQNPSSGQFVGSNDPSKQTPSAIEATTQQDNAILPSFTLSNPPRYPIKHRHLAAKIKFSAHTVDLSNLKFYIQFCLHAAYAFHLPCSLPTSLPIQTSLRTVPRSAFVHKPSQENFIKKVHSRYFKIFDSDVETVKEYLEYIASNGLEGVSLKANIFDRKEVGFGQKMVTPKEGREIEEPTQERVKQMADDLIQSGFGSNEPAEVDTSVATAKEPASVVDITNN